MKRFPINIWVAVFLVIALIVVISINVRPPSLTTRDFSSFVLAVKNAAVRSVTVLPQGGVIEITVEPKSGEKFRVMTTALDPWGSPSFLRERGVTQVTVETASSLNWLALLTTLIPLLILGAFLFFMLRGMRGPGGGDGAMGFAKSKAKVVSESAPKTSFREVAGCDEAKEELAEVVDFLKNPARYHDIGARIPKGVLLVGPGSGKTLLAKAVAGEARVPFFSISGSDFVEMFVGVGAARVRSLFEDARKAAPCIIFIDEIDAVGRKRGSGMGGGNDEREQTLNQLLVEMDGFETKSDIIILAATNRPDVLDAALLRPGRFDRQVVVDAPDVKGREEILRVHSRKKPLEENVDLRVVARRTPGFVGADLENLLNEAALLAARAGRRKVSLRDLDEAADRVTMGAARKSRVIPDADKLITAYHEVGHALGMLLLPHADRPHKLTIVPRGRAAGYAMPMPSESEHYSKNRLLDRIAVALAGRAAEELQFGDVTTGAQNDFQQATNIARRMVAEWGMSDTLGHVALIEEQRGYLGGGMESRNYSEDTARAIDAEVKEIIEVQYVRVLELLSTHRSGMERIVRVLLERETLTGEEFQIILEGGELPAEEPALKRPIKDKPEPGFIPPTVLPKPGRA